MINNIITKYHNLSLPVKATLWFTMSQFFVKGIGLLTTPFTTRILSTEEYGRISTFASWESLFLVLNTFSSGHAVMNLCVKYKDRKCILSSVIILNILLSLMWGMIILLTASTIIQFTGLSIIMIMCLYLSCIFRNIISGWTFVKQYEYSYKIIVIETIIYSLVTSVGGLLSIAIISKTAEAKIIPQVVAASLIGMLIVISSLKNSKIKCNSDIWKYTLNFCIPLLPHYLSEIVLMSSDKIMIDRMCGSSDVAIYSVAYAVGSLIMMLASAVDSAFAPYQYQKITNKEYKTLAINTNYIIIFVAFSLDVIMLFGREIVLVFGGIKYIQSISLIIPISLGVFFNYIFRLFARVQEYFEQKYTIVIASVSCALLNIILNYIFINIYSYKAAAYTTFFCYFVFCFLHYLFYRMACRKHIGQEIYDIKGLALISAAMMVSTLVIGIISRLFILKYIILLVAIIIVLLQRKRILNFVKTIREK